MGKYNDKKINDLINSYYEYKDQHPYRGAEWRTNSENARTCVNILTQIGELIRQLINEENLVRGYQYEVHVSRGAGYFPRSPWVGFLFNNERPTRGVYPVFGFFGDDAGCYFACTRSFNGEEGFVRFCDMANVTEEVAARWDRIGFETHERVATCFPGSPLVKPRGERIVRSELVQAIKRTFDAYARYRGL